MKEAGRSADGLPGLPWVRLPPLPAPGPTGERLVHLENVMSCTTIGVKRRFKRALDTLTVRWATGSLPDQCRWLLNTRVLFLRKDRDPVDKDFDDMDWLNNVPDDEVTAELPSAAPPKVRPIQMGEFIRK